MGVVRVEGEADDGGRRYNIRSPTMYHARSDGDRRSRTFVGTAPPPSALVQMMPQVVPQVLQSHPHLVRHRLRRDPHGFGDLPVR
jgi:hypothetical protein